MENIEDKIVDNQFDFNITVKTSLPVSKSKDYPDSDLKEGMTNFSKIEIIEILKNEGFEIEEIISKPKNIIMLECKDDEHQADVINLFKLFEGSFKGIKIR